ncbi:MAG: hypothetical protein QM710_13650 [Flavobacterium sp.]
MKNTSFIEQVKCIIKNDCDNERNHEAEIREEDLQTETISDETSMEFHRFDIDEIFAN